MSEVPNIKTEPVDVSEIENRILELLEQSDGEITNRLLQVAMSTYPKNDLVSAINRLTSQNKMAILAKGKNQLIYKLVGAKATSQLKSLSIEQQEVFKIISAAGTKGIWSREIRAACGINQSVMNGALKQLEGRKLIKAVKSVNTPKQKIYMLYDVEPDASVTGGAWYCDQEFESEFVEVLNKQCYSFLQECRNAAEKKGEDPITCRNSSYKSTKEIAKYINDLKVSRVQLEEENIEDILNTLIADGKIEKKVVVDSSCSTGRENTVNLYRAVPPIVLNSPLMRMPCGVCHVYKDCREGSLVSPSTCIYMKEWFDY